MQVIRCLALLAAFAFAMPPAPSEAVAGASLAALPSAYAGARQTPALFGTREIYSRDISAFGKWTDVLARFRLEQAAARSGCAGEPACDEWREMLGALGGLDLRAKLDLVNSAVNRHPYVASQSNWGESNHWETPFEFLRKSGQCQDYAITKYLLLRAAGVPAAQLRVLVLRDTELGLDHAVTVAYVDGAALLLDNQISTVVPVDSVRHYQPYYSINEAGWWLHVGPHARYASAEDGALR
ncbi:MAG TPA: transglutaminase-like cysteine peptidase [Stellaceae bacterium]|nr:transglutaminase-like cysteine peptidase [Stellaceae bacterium]